MNMTHMKPRYKYGRILIIVPFLLGTYGYMQENVSMLDALYSALRLYSINVDPPAKMNIYIELARWLAAGITTTVIISLFRKTLSEVSIRRRLRAEDAVVLHGPAQKCETLAQHLGGKTIITQSNARFQGKTHVIAFENDVEATEYIAANAHRLFDGNDRRVYLCANEYEASDYVKEGFLVTNCAMNCARLYWRQHWFREESALSVAIIGGGNYAKWLLKQALLVNVSAWRAPIAYHTYNLSGERFTSWHTQLHNVVSVDSPSGDMDQIYFHSNIDVCDISALRDMRRIILIEDDEAANLRMLNRLLAAGVTGEYHVKCNAALLARMQYIPARQASEGNLSILAFGEDSQLYTRDVLLHSVLYEDALKAHISYIRNSRCEDISRKYPACIGCVKRGRCDDCLRVQHTWHDLTPFEKASNVAVADHIPVKLHMLALAEARGGIDANYSDLCRAEHERWQRFHYLQNWQYGAKRDNSKHIHNLLVPYDALTREDQQKDWWNYELLLAKNADKAV